MYGEETHNPLGQQSVVDGERPVVGEAGGVGVFEQGRQLGLGDGWPGMRHLTLLSLFQQETQLLCTNALWRGEGMCMQGLFTNAQALEKGAWLSL